MGFVFLEIGNVFLEIGKNGPYLALGMGPNIGPVRRAEKALTRFFSARRVVLGCLTKCETSFEILSP
jgi:hypothetical protein